MNLKLITPPTLEPLTLAELKQDLRVGHTDDDASLTRYMREARDWIQERVGFVLLTQTWLLSLDAFPASEIELTVVPVQSITTVKYDDEAGVEQTMSSGDYFLDNSDPNMAWLFPEASWPATLDAVNAVRVTFVSGYEAASQLPPSLVSVFRLKVRELYDGDDQTKQIENLLSTYNVMVA